MDRSILEDLSESRPKFVWVHSFCFYMVKLGKKKLGSSRLILGAQTLRVKRRQPVTDRPSGTLVVRCLKSESKGWINMGKQSNFCWGHKTCIIQKLGQTYTYCTSHETMALQHSWFTQTKGFLLKRCVFTYYKVRLVRLLSQLVNSSNNQKSGSRICWLLAAVVSQQKCTAGSKATNEHFVYKACYWQPLQMLQTLHPTRTIWGLPSDKFKKKKCHWRLTALHKKLFL